MNVQLIRILSIWCLILVSNTTIHAQLLTKPEIILAQLDSLAETNPGLNETITMSVNDITVGELIRGIGISHNLNLNVGQSLIQVVATSFSEVPVKDVLIFLIREYSLQVEFSGNILSFSKFTPLKIPIPYIPKIPTITYFPDSNFLSLDLNNDSIRAVTMEITKKSGRNVLFTPSIANSRITSYIENMDFENAIEKMALANNISVEKTEDGFYVLDAAVQIEPVINKNSPKASRDLNMGLESNTGLQIYSSDSTVVSILAKNTPLALIIEKVSEILNKEYFIYDPIEGNVNLRLDNVSYEEFLNYAFNGSVYSYANSEDVYLLGNQTTQGLRNSELIKLENRTVEKITESIPTELSKDLFIKEFLDMNALIVSGSTSKIRDLRNFVREIDQVIPMIYIEVMLVDVNKSRSISAGISAGLGKQAAPVVTGGTLSPGIDFQMNSETVNNLISGFNSFGIVNLGNVSPDFYLSIQALETSGVLKTRSTPKLSALNGQEASLNIGRTEYYLEVRNDISGSLNPTISTSQIYKPISANTSLFVTPFVSKDEQVTLEIKVVQSDFTERISELAPPGNVQRDFSSVVRVKNGDMIILGGLDGDSKSESGSGLPWISRVPVLKWIFGKRTKSTSEQKLSIFLRTTIIY